MIVRISLIALSILFATCERGESTQDKPLMVDASATEIMDHIRTFENKKPVLVNVWATWCIPCVEEFPYIMKLKETYGDDFELVFISGDFEEAKEEAVTFLKEQNVDFTTYYKTGNDNEFIQTLSPDWSGALPFTLIIASDGSVSAQWEGKATYEEFESELLTVIKRS